MISPYKNTILRTHVSLPPQKITNELRYFINEELKKKVEGKCCEYGFISKIYNITNIQPPFIPAENPFCSIDCGVEYSCRLCLPIQNTQIIAKVNKISQVLITAENGPISILITIDRINKNIFYVDNNGYLRYKGKDKSYLLNENDYIKITVESVASNHKDVKIKVIGQLENMASDSDIKFYHDQLNFDPDKAN
jgi:DNA-directed RNA polymerase subunit E'/Rpb7